MKENTLSVVKPTYPPTYAQKKNHLCTIFSSVETTTTTTTNYYLFLLACSGLLLVDCSLVELSLDKRTHRFSTFSKVLPWLKPKASGPCTDDKFAPIVARAFQTETTTKDI